MTINRNKLHSVTEIRFKPKGSKDDRSNYRLISVLSVIFRLLEKLVFCKLYSQIDGPSNDESLEGRVDLGTSSHVTAVES